MSGARVSVFLTTRHKRECDCFVGGRESVVPERPCLGAYSVAGRGGRAGAWCSNERTRPAEIKLEDGRGHEVHEVVRAIKRPAVTVMVFENPRLEPLCNECNLTHLLHAGNTL